MAKARAEQKGNKKSNKRSQKSMNGHAKAMETPEELYATALTLVEQSQPEEALKKAKKLLSLVQNQGVAEVLPALNLLGEINVECGDPDAARQCFEKAVALDPDGQIPESLGGGAEKFLWLAQLCEEGGQRSVTWFEKGIIALQVEISVLENEASDLDEASLLLSRMEKKRKLANALCGIVEVFMTDLSWEDDAETRCENLITEAMTVEDEPSPEVLQTLASVRLSQDRLEDAQAALRRSIETWKDLEPEDPEVPDFPTRISLARLLMEANMHREAMVVLDRLVGEDDQSVEAWYLGGWCQYLISEDAKVPHTAQNGDEQLVDSVPDPERTMKGARHWLKTSIKLYDLLDYEDDRLLDHAEELVTLLDKALGPEDEDAEGGEDDLSEDEWEGLEDDVEVDEEMLDV